MSAFGCTADMILCGNPLSRSLLGAKRTCHFALHMSANDPKRTFQLFSRYPPWCICLGCDLASNDVDVTAQIIQLVREGKWKTDVADSLFNALDFSLLLGQ